jgi:hypothetical protein
MPREAGMSSIRANWQRVDTRPERRWSFAGVFIENPFA